MASSQVCFIHKGYLLDKLRTKHFSRFIGVLFVSLILYKTIFFRLVKKGVKCVFIIKQKTDFINKIIKQFVSSPGRQVLSVQYIISLFFEKSSSILTAIVFVGCL